MDPNCSGRPLYQELLHRDATTVYGIEARHLIKGCTALVTGAGGSIGSEIVRQLRRLGAKRIICVDICEYVLYELERELTGTALLTDGSTILADIRDLEMLKRIFDRYRPQIVFHAAACKHLPLLERSPEMAVLTNVQGTDNVVRAAIASGVDRLVNISTDKAANPSSVLGMSKRLGEFIIRDHAGEGTRLASVRFGNVFGSRGSFIETLIWQIANDKPITVTDGAATRYFMSIPQAASLVIEASAMAEEGSTYVLDMGQSHRILDLVERYGRLLGVEPRITFTGLREGEKTDEELFDPLEARMPTANQKIWEIEIHRNAKVDLSSIEALCRSAGSGSPPDELRAELRRLSHNKVTTFELATTRGKQP